MNIIAYPSLETLQKRSLCKGKFLRLRWKGTDTLLLADQEHHPFHNEILSRFLSEHGISAHVAGSDSQLKQLQQLSDLGGGRFTIDWSNANLTLSASSTSYGRFNAEGIDHALRTTNHPLAQLNLAIQ